ncbi:hypothetical protein MNBD_GAMMA16-2129 [hydrothermal vent metagenome]|uniref:DUF5666 domain-containing protein n=1 Tax=hydrothermal vent metagenome TaxID=652676 RepID=A0A3B0ZYN6_9ZZZZ
MFRWVFIVIGLMLFPVSASFACESAGPNVHIGEVTSISSGTFTLLDAETGSPIKFAASSEVLLALAGLNRTIAVDYQEEEGQLIALAVR